IILLTFVIGLKNPAAEPMKVVFNTVAFFGLAAIGGIAINYLFKYFDKKYPHRRRIPIYGFVLCLVLAYVAEHYFGIADITGAFVAGIILCNIQSSEYIVEKIDINSYMLFSPIFFTSIGLKTEITGVTTMVLLFSVGFVVVALLTKIVGCGIGAKLIGFSSHEALRVGVGMMARGEVALIVAQKGLSAGLMDPSLFTAVIFLVIVSSVTTPIILKILYKKEDAQEQTNIAYAQ
ncbi:MAG: cation:proton antiporter, partial [Niameybacter sp.]